jgi:3-dehydroquinate synthase class II
MTMESGVDVICLETNDANELAALDAMFCRDQVVSMPLVPATVTVVRQAGMGDRVCIDTTSELFQDEGILLGSTSGGGIVTCSETHELPYMELRPFRVNAGALHLYVWAPNNHTYYLSELRAGHDVLVVNSKGEARAVTIGRLKIERRPLLFIEAEVDGEKINTFIQDDWHVRLMGEGGAILPSSEIKPGDRLLAYIDTPGRHVGIQISETITER